MGKAEIRYMLQEKKPRAAKYKTCFFSNRHTRRPRRGAHIVVRST